MSPTVLKFKDGSITEYERSEYQKEIKLMSEHLGEGETFRELIKKVYAFMGEFGPRELSNIANAISNLPINSNTQGFRFIPTRSVIKK